MSTTPTVNPQPKVQPYLTIIPTRRPVQKLHANLGHAKNAINNACYNYSNKAYDDLELWQWSAEGGWELLHFIKAGTGRGQLPWVVAK